MPDTGDIRVSIFAGDRQLWRGGEVTLKLIDPFSQEHRSLVNKLTKAGTNTVVLQGARADSGQRYSLIATTDGHRDAGIFPVKPIPGQEVSVAVMLLPNKPALNLSGFSFAALENKSPQFLQALTAAGIAEQDFRGLDPNQIAGALNIEAKLRNTTLAGAPAVQSLRRIGSPDPLIAGTAALRQDRIFVFTDPAMPDQVRQDIDQTDGKSFVELLEFENEVFHKGFPVSFKQRVSFGSLQLSFASKAGDNNLLAADIDIDLLTDVGHFGEVMQNFLLQQKTDPFTVYRLLFDQGITPLYSLAVGQAASAPN